MAVTRIDLAEIDELRVPHPDTLWIYQKDPKSRKREFIEIETISKDKKKTKNNYLISSNKKVYCDGVNKAGPEEMDVPLQAIASLKIVEYTYRDANKPKKEEPKAEAAPAK